MNLAIILKITSEDQAPLFAKRISKEIGDVKVYFKRDELNHTGAHKINNCVGQVLLAKKMGKKRIVAETGAGQHGLATATVCALFNLKCVVYMGALDIKRQAPNVFKMKLLGAEIIPVKSGTSTLKDAMNEALRDWVSNVKDTFLRNRNRRWTSSLSNDGKGFSINNWDRSKETNP